MCFITGDLMWHNIRNRLSVECGTQLCCLFHKYKTSQQFVEIYKRYCIKKIIEKLSYIENAWAKYKYFSSIYNNVNLMIEISNTGTEI